jgi:hypothetical protein
MGLNTSGLLHSEHHHLDILQYSTSDVVSNRPAALKLRSHYDQFSLPDE